MRQAQRRSRRRFPSLKKTPQAIDRWLRELVLISTALFALASLALGLWGMFPAAAMGQSAPGAWLMEAPRTLFQTASAKTIGEAADVAQSMIVTVWNIAIAGGGLAGGVLLDTLGVGSFPWTLVALLIPTLLVAWLAKSHGFPQIAG